MIDCLKCYRLRRHNDTVYCPFLDLKECVRGEHYINIASLPFKPKQEETPPLPPKMVKAIPPFKPHPNSPHDWEKFHNQIFEIFYFHALPPLTRFQEVFISLYQS